MEIKHKVTGEVLLNIEGDALQGSNLEGVDLRFTDLKGVDLEGVNLRDAHLEFANLEGANLRWANLDGVNLQWADLRYANLKYADLRFANLREANLQRANLVGTNLVDATLPTNVIRIDGMKWDVTILYGYIRIGCQYHHVDVWNEFTDDEIATMAHGASEFWKENKQILITVASFTK